MEGVKWEDLSTELLVELVWSRWCWMLPLYESHGSLKIKHRKGKRKKPCKIGEGTRHGVCLRAHSNSKVIQTFGQASNKQEGSVDIIISILY